MKSTVEHLSPTRVRINVEVPFDELKPDFDRAYKNIAKQVKIPGFRPGKAPARILEARIGRGPVLDEVVNSAIPNKYSEAISGAEDVTHAADGTWHIKAGARVRVKLTMVNENRRYHVALVDPMPAGFEAMNPALAVTGPIPEDPNEQKSRGAYWWWYGTWYEHQNLRDERVEAFASLLWEGVHEYSYVARATTPGNFVVPPPKAEEMYMPETFGRGGSDRVIIQ